MELARQRLESKKPSLAKRALLGQITHPGRMRLQLALSRLVPGKRIPKALSYWLSGQAPEVEKPRAQPKSAWLPLQEDELVPLRGEVALLEGCAMRVLFPRVHEATRRLLRRVGYAVRPSNAGCCGALHAHAGLLDEGKQMAITALEALGQDLPIIVNSAGCGSHLKDLARHEGLSPRGQIQDVSEFLLAEGLLEQLRQTSQLSGRTATYHDACHLAHGQQITAPPRQLLQAIPGLALRPLPEADLCCGSAGIYNVSQPQMARRLLERKWKHIEATGSEIVVLGNPGCHAWIAQASKEHGGRVRVLHTAELLESAFSGLPAI